MTFEQPFQSTFDDSKRILLDMWFPDKTAPKSRPAVLEVQVERPVGAGEVWTYTAKAEMFGALRRVTIKTRDPGAATYELADALEAKYMALQASILEQGGYLDPTA